MTKDELRQARADIALGWALVCEAYLARAKAAFERGCSDYEACSALFDAAQQVLDAGDWLPVEVEHGRSSKKS